MNELYLYHTTWFVLSSAFGYWMYTRGATLGVKAGVKAASLYLVLNGQEKDVPALLDFVNDLSGGNIEKYK